MTVGELRLLLNDMPDDLPVVVSDYDEIEKTFYFASVSSADVVPINVDLDGDGGYDFDAVWIDTSGPFEGE